MPMGDDLATPFNMTWCSTEVWGQTVRVRHAISITTDTRNSLQSLKHPLIFSKDTWVMTPGGLGGLLQLLYISLNSDHHQASGELSSTTGHI